MGLVKIHQTGRGLLDVHHFDPSKKVGQPVALRLVEKLADTCDAILKKILMTVHARATLRTLCLQLEVAGSSRSLAAIRMSMPGAWSLTASLTQAASLVPRCNDACTTPLQTSLWPQLLQPMLLRLHIDMSPTFT